MKRLILALLSCPTILGSAFCYLSALPVLAAEVGGHGDAKVCVWSPHKQGNLVCSRVDKILSVKAAPPVDLASNPQDSPVKFEFSDDESNAAIALFGCDCPLCINSLRNLRTIAAQAG